MVRAMKGAIDGTSDRSRSSRRRYGSGSCRRSGGWCDEGDMDQEAVEGDMDQEAVEGDMDQEAVEGYMDQEAVEGAVDGASDGRRDR